MDFNWFDHLYALFIMVAIPLMTLRNHPEEEEEEDITDFLPPKKHLFYTNGLMLVIGALLVLTSWNISNRPWSSVGIAWPVFNQASIVVIILVSVYYLGDVIYGWQNKKATTEKMNELSFMLPVTWQEFRHFLFLAFSAGISEEVIFRGFLVSYLNKVLVGWPGQPWLAIIIPGLAFAASHIYQGWWAVLKISALAVCFGYIFLLTGSLLPVIVLHVLIDVISGLSGVLYMQNHGSKEGRDLSDS